MPDRMNEVWTEADCELHDRFVFFPRELPGPPTVRLSQDSCEKFSVPYISRNGFELRSLEPKDNESPYNKSLFSSAKFTVHTDSVMQPEDSPDA